MSWRAWRPTISQIFRELKQSKLDTLRLMSKGFSSEVSHQISILHGMEVQFSNKILKSNGVHWMIPFSVRTLASSSTTQSNQQTKQEKHGKDIAKQDPFDPLTDQIPEQPVTFAEGASYSLVIFAGLAIAAGAAYAVFKELIFEPKETQSVVHNLVNVASEGQDSSQSSLKVDHASKNNVFRAVKHPNVKAGTRSSERPWRECRMIARLKCE